MKFGCAKTKQLISFVFISIAFVSCNKNTDTPGQPTAIDVSKQWTVNANKQLIFGLGDGQWQAKSFSSQELSLFASLDTANLSGTSKPDSVFEVPISFNCTYPNPFIAFTKLVFKFSNAFNGEMVLKTVIADSLMNPIDKKAIRIQAISAPQIPFNPSASNEISIIPSAATGRFRLYYTLSSSANPHFYKSWGNIQRTQ